MAVFRIPSFFRCLLVMGLISVQLALWGIYSHFTMAPSHYREHELRARMSDPSSSQLSPVDMKTNGGATTEWVEEMQRQVQQTAELQRQLADLVYRDIQRRNNEHLDTMRVVARLDGREREAQWNDETGVKTSLNKEGNGLEGGELLSKEDMLRTGLSTQQRAYVRQRQAESQHRRWGGGQNCEDWELGGVWAAQPRRKVYYGFLGNSELDLISLNLHELGPVVDHIIFLESNVSFSGKKKDLVFERLRQEESYKRYGDKVRYLPMLDCAKCRCACLAEPNDPMEHEWAWLREDALRNSALLGAQDMGDDDIFVLADVDELLSRDFVRALKHCESTRNSMVDKGTGLVNVSKCRRDLAATWVLNYHFDCIGPQNHWHPDWALGICIKANNWTAQEMRMGIEPVHGSARMENVGSHMTSFPVGWHLSNFLSPENLRRKHQHFAETAFGRAGNPYSNLTFLRQLADTCQRPLKGSDNNFRTDGTQFRLPRGVTENLWRYGHLLSAQPSAQGICLAMKKRNVKRQRLTAEKPGQTAEKGLEDDGQGERQEEYVQPIWMRRRQLMRKALSSSGMPEDLSCLLDEYLGKMDVHNLRWVRNVAGPATSCPTYQGVVNRHNCLVGPGLLTVLELKEELRKAGLPISGLKAVLLARFSDYLATMRRNSISIKKQNKDKFRKLYGISADNEHIVASDNEACSVLLFDKATGAFVRKFGSKGSGKGQFNRPGGLCLNGGIVYICDTNNNRIQVLTKEGVFLRFIGAAISKSKLVKPVGVSVDEQYVFVSSCGNGAGFPVSSFSKASGAFVRKFGCWGDGAWQFHQPFDVCHDEENIYVCDRGNNRVQILTKKGVFIRSIGDGSDYSKGVAVDEQHLFVSSGDFIKVFTKQDGALVREVRRAATQVQYQRLALSDGLLFAVDETSQCCSVFEG